MKASPIALSPITWQFVPNGPQGIRISTNCCSLIKPLLYYVEQYTLHGCTQFSHYKNLVAKYPEYQPPN